MRTRLALTLVLMMVLIAYLNGCSTERGKSFSPIWTGFAGSLLPELATWSVAVTGDRASLKTGEKAVLTVRVMNQEGSPGKGTVLLASSLGGTFSTLTDPTATSGCLLNLKGEAQSYFTAGSLPGITTIRASFGVANASLPVTVTNPEQSTYTIALNTGRTSLKAGEKTLLTVKVTDPLGLPGSGSVRLACSPAGNFSGVFDPTATTSFPLDPQGEAVMNFTAGNALGTATIQAWFGLSSTTRTIQVTSPDQSTYTIALNTGRTSLKAGEKTQLTVKVTDPLGLPGSGSVRLACGPAGNLSGVFDPTATTSFPLDLQGEAVMNFTAGNALGTATIQAWFGLSSTTQTIQVTTPYPYVVTLGPDSNTVASQTALALIIRVRDQAGLLVTNEQLVTLTAGIGNFSSDLATWSKPLTNKVTGFTTVYYQAAQAGLDQITAYSANAETVSVSVTITN